MPAAAKLRNPIAKRNLGPSLIHANRARFFEKVEAVTAPAPLLRRLHQSAFHRIAVHVSQLLDPLPRCPNVEVVEARLPECSPRSRALEQVALAWVHSSFLRQQRSG